MAYTDSVSVVLRYGGLREVYKDFLYFTLEILPTTY